MIAAGKFYAFTYASREGKHNSKANAWDCWLTVSVSANGTASSILTTPFISLQAMNRGRRLQLGAAGDRDRFRGDLAEVILFNTELSEADRTTVLAYLRTKYGLRDDVSRLPADPVIITPTLDKQTFWFRDAVTVEWARVHVGQRFHRKQHDAHLRTVRTARKNRCPVGELAGLVALEQAGRGRLAQRRRGRHAGVLYWQVSLQCRGRKWKVLRPEKEDRALGRRPMGQGVSRLDDGLKLQEDRLVSGWRAGISFPRGPRERDGSERHQSLSEPADEEDGAQSGIGWQLWRIP